MDEDTLWSLISLLSIGVIIFLMLLFVLIIPSCNEKKEEIKNYSIEASQSEWNLYYNENINIINNEIEYVIICNGYVFEAKGENFITSPLKVKEYKDDIDLTLDEYGNEKFGYNADVKIYYKNHTNDIVTNRQIALKNAKTEWGLFLSEYVDDFKYNNMYIVICTYDNVEYVYETKGVNFNTENINIDTSIYDNALDLTLDSDGNEKFGYNKDVKIYAKIIP